MRDDTDEKGALDAYMGVDDRSIYLGRVNTLDEARERAAELAKTLDLPRDGYSLHVAPRMESGE